MPRGGRSRHGTRTTGGSSGQSSRGISSSSSSRGLSDSVHDFSLEVGAASSHTEPDGLKRLSISNRQLMPSNDISHSIFLIFKRMMHHEGFSWKDVLSGTKELYFEEFKKEWTWDPQLERRVHDLWMSKAGVRYRDMIYIFKLNRESQRPECIPEQVWPAWLNYWNRDEVKEKARKAKKNRLAEPDGSGTGISKHRGGSRCAEQHTLVLAKEKGVPVEKISE